jgi:uncharacterized membrane protein YfcA
MLETFAQYDLSFYIASALGVLIMGISKSGFGAGIGFLAVPLIASFSSLNLALSLLLPILLAIDLFGLTIYIKHFDKKLMRLMLPCGLVGIILGTIFFNMISSATLSIMVGVFILAFLLFRLAFPTKPNSPKPPKWLGVCMSGLAGFTSFIAHNGGPPMAVYMIPQKLPPITYAATLSIFFTVINLSKWIPYAYLGILRPGEFLLSLALLPVVPIGVWLGYIMAKRLRIDIYYKIVYLGMLVGGIKMVMDGFQ